MFWENYEWINVEKAHPPIRAEVLFVVDSNDKSYHLRIMSGKYCGKKYGYHAFSIPGIEFKGSHWGVLPELPIEVKAAPEIHQPTNGFMAPDCQSVAQTAKAAS